MGVRIQNQACLVKLNEMFSGISGDDRVEMEDRNNQAVGIRIWQAYQELGERARGFNLQMFNAETGECGVYSIIKHESTDAIIENRFTNELFGLLKSRASQSYGLT